MDIKQKYYNQVDAELKKRYKAYVGVNPDDVEIKYFTTKDQIERYAKNLSFWLIESEPVNMDNLTGKQVAKKFIVANAKKNIINIINNKFEPTLVEQINILANTYIQLWKHNNNFINEIEDLRIKMIEWSETSNKLYNLVKDECKDLPDPTNWLINQEKMRNSWEEYKNTKTENNLVNKLLLNNNFAKYMDFMYNTYPKGYGEKLQQLYKDKIYCDGALEFYKIIMISCTN